MKYVNYFIVAFAIITSGSVFFTYKNNISSLILFSFGVFILFLKNRKLIKTNITSGILIVVYVIINTLINQINDLNYTSIISYTIKILLMVLFCSNISAKKFKNNFINVMCIFSVISLFCFIYSEINPNKFLPLTNIEFIDEKPYIFSFYHTYGWASYFHRNAGIFWEPGAYQIYLNLAIIFVLDKTNIAKNDIRKSILLIITILTTKSTTGYIILIIVLLSYFLRLKVKVKNKSKTIIKIGLTLFSIVAILIFLFNSSVVRNKFQSDSTSYNIRANDLLGSIDIVKKRPLIGYGILSKELILMQAQRNITSNSNGILFISSMLGVVFTIVIILLHYKNSKYLLENTDKRIFSIIFILFNVTEVIIFMPIFFIFLFRFQEEGGLNSEYESITCSN